VLGIYSMGDFYKTGADMKSLWQKVKDWLNKMLDVFFKPVAGQPAPTPTQPTPSSVDVQINDLVTKLVIVGDKFQ